MKLADSSPIEKEIGEIKCTIKKELGCVARAHLYDIVQAYEKDNNIDDFYQKVMKTIFCEPYPSIDDFKKSIVDIVNFLKAHYRLDQIPAEWEELIKSVEVSNKLTKEALKNIGGSSRAAIEDMVKAIGKAGMAKFMETMEATKRATMISEEFFKESLKKQKEQRERDLNYGMQPLRPTSQMKYNAQLDIIESNREVVNVIEKQISEDAKNAKRIEKAVLAKKTIWYKNPGWWGIILTTIAILTAIIIA